jgi:hypothetical protein
MSETILICMVSAACAVISASSATLSLKSVAALILGLLVGLPTVVMAANMIAMAVR